MAALQPEYIEDDLIDDLDDLDEEDIDDLVDDLSERRRRRRRSGPRVRGRAYAPPTQRGHYVTQAQQQATLSRVGTDVRRLATHGRTVETRLDRAYEKLKTDMQRSQQMAMLLPLLMRPKTVSANLSTSEGTEKHDVMVDSGDSLGLLLPLMLMSQGGAMSGDNNAMMMIALVIAMDKK